MRTLATAISAALLLPVCALAQTSTGTITGTITDATGAVVPLARVVIMNAGTNAKVEVVSNASGDYTAPLLPPAPTP